MPGPRRFGAERATSARPTAAGTADAPPPLWRADVTTAMTVLVVALFAIPAQLVVGPLGSAGSPAGLVGLALFAYWVLRRVLGHRRPHAATGPVVLVGLAHLGAVLVSYALAMGRPLDGAEILAADRGLLSGVALLGIVLVLADRPPSRDRLTTLLRRVRMAGALVALLGLVQFVTDQAWVDRLDVPGLVANSGLPGIIDRSGFARPSGTATHPIEFGVVLTLLLPIAIHFAVQDWPRRRWLAWWPVAAIGFALPVSLSRTTVLCAVTAAVVLLPTWSPRMRLRAVAAGAGGLIAVFLLVPRLLGTITKLFTGISSDGSARSRTDSYGIAFEFVARSPLFGRGPGTFLPRYRILDNDYLGQLVTVGVVGLALFLAFLAVSGHGAWSVGRRSPDTEVRSLSYALLASICAGAAGLVTFDAAAFPQVPTTLHLLIGCSVALAAVARPEAEAAPPDGPGSP